jgi:TetR/AcrR family transcriptional repressor of nem operon
MGDLNERFREKLEDAFLKMKHKISQFLNAAIANREIDPSLAVDEAADFILNSWEGALMRLKITRTKTQMILFYNVIFDKLLKKKDVTQQLI